ncbi:hypothetical protein HYV73_00260 [Candidatus Uhrbacteria bacterium]|nr:hypothetical protein [Candidatus Uhrbacteria bacterium]
MNVDHVILLISLGIPACLIAFCWCVLLFTMRRTTGELRLFLSAENLVKGMVVIFVLLTTTALSILGILSGELAGTIIGGIIGYTLGTKFSVEK